MGNARQGRLAGTLYAVGGGLWFLLAATMTALYGIELPPGTTGFYVTEAIFVVVQALLLVGWFGLRWSGAVGQGWFGRIAFWLGALGHLIFVVAEIHSLLIGTLSMLLPLGAITSAVGMLLTGIAVLLAKAWRGWTRWVPLLAGLYPWVAMFPFLALEGEPSGYAIAGWGLMRLALGLAIRAQADAESITDAAPASTMPQRSA